MFDINTEIARIKALRADNADYSLERWLRERRVTAGIERITRAQRREAWYAFERAEDRRVRAEETIVVRRFPVFGQAMPSEQFWAEHDFHTRIARESYHANKRGY